MKKILLFLLVALISKSAISQAGDPAVNAPFFTENTSTNQINGSALTVNDNANLRVTFVNNKRFSDVPAGSIRIVFDLGSSLQLQDGSNTALANLPLATIFQFTYGQDPTTGYFQVIATQRSTTAGVIPADFSGEFTFPVRVYQSTPAGGTTANANIETIANNPNNYDDPVTSNNSSSVFYQTTTTLDVRFVNVNATSNSCVLTVNWQVAEQSNVGNYVVELSTDGRNWRNVSEVPASNTENYNAKFNIPSDLQANTVFVRVRENSLSGKATFSSVKAVRGTCDESRQLIVHAYPNPVTSNNFINIGAKQGVFNGKYKLELVDNSGKTYQVKEVQVANAVVIPFEFKTALSPGNYMIRVSNLDGTQSSTVQFIKVGGVL